MVDRQAKGSGSFILTCIVVYDLLMMADGPANRTVLRHTVGKVVQSPNYRLSIANRKLDPSFFYSTASDAEVKLVDHRAVILLPKYSMAILRSILCAALLGACVFGLLTLPSESFRVVTTTPRCTAGSRAAGMASWSSSFPTTAWYTHGESSTTCSIRQLAADPSDTDETTLQNNKKSPLPMFLDVGTKGGALFLSLVLFCVPLSLYQLVTTTGGVDPETAGVAIGVGFTSVLTLGWVSTLLVRVVNKDMTYVRD